MHIIQILIAGVATLALAGCGETPLEQVLYGGGAGLAGAAVLDGDLATGAAVGAVGNVVYCQTYPERC